MPTDRGYLARGAGELVKRYLSRFEARDWNRFTGFAFDGIRPDLLTDGQIDSLKTALLVEDHIPGYSRAYSDMFALDPGLPAAELAFRRQMLHFVFRWSCDEDRHAHTLENYLRACGRVDDEALTREMLATVVRPYRAPHGDALRMTVYTVIQEKATQVFYSCLRDAAAEPVLKDVLARLASDEARHCGFFVDLLKVFLGDPGGADYAAVQEAVQEFKMPLFDTLDDYRRRSITMMRSAPGYHYRDAFGLIRQAVGRCADAGGASRPRALEELLAVLDARGPVKV